MRGIVLAFFFCAGAAPGEVINWQRYSQHKARYSPWRVGAGRTRALASLGAAVELSPGSWPKLSRRTVPWLSIRRVPRKGDSDWKTGRSFGFVAAGDGRPKGMKLSEVGWSHAAAEFTSGSGRSLQVWVSRTSPALLFRSDASRVAFFAGKDAPEVRFWACEVGGEVKTFRAGALAMSVAKLLKSTRHAREAATGLPGGSWILVWFGDQFTSSRFSGYVKYPYPADCPMLFFFQNAPEELSFKGAMSVRFGPEAGAGYIAMLPLYGDSYPLAVSDDKWMKKTLRIGRRSYPAEFRKYCYPPDLETHTWERGLPGPVVESCRRWAERLHEFPVSVAESYAYDRGRDVLTVTEKFAFKRLKEGGTTLAPIPPMLALAKEEGFPVEFSGPVVKTSVLTAHGPFAGIENARSYTWRVQGLGRYVFEERRPQGSGRAPQELLDELDLEVREILDAGELAPWYPVLDDNGAGYMGYYDRGFRGHFVFGNPGETIYYLAEAHPFLKPETQRRVVAYLKDLRAKHPPERPSFLLLGQGAPRERYRPTPPYIVERLNKNFQGCNFYLHNRLAPERNLYHLARYYELMGERDELEDVWEDMPQMLNPYLMNLDWGTMGLLRRPVSWYGRAGLGGVIDVNNLFAAMVGAVRLARMAGDRDAEETFWGLFGKVAALRFAMGKYPAYLYRHGLMRPAEGKDWMMRLLRGSWHGYLYTMNWSGPEDEVQQIWQMDQFGVNFREDRWRAWPGIMTFLEPVPELGRFFKDHLKDESKALMRRVNEAMPAWWTVYCPCVQTWETSFQPPEDAHQLFMLSAWVLDERPERLAWLRDVPWLARGDLFYIHKLAETIRAYRRSGGGG